MVSAANIRETQYEKNPNNNTNNLLRVTIALSEYFLLVPTTILINDIYLKYSNIKYSDKMIVTLSRMLVLALGFFSYWVSRMFAADTTIFEKALYAFTIYGTAITPTLLAAFFCDKATKYGAICSIISGIVATVYFGNQWSLDEAVIPALAISSSALLLVSLIKK